MPVQVVWDNPQKTVLRWNFIEVWTWDEVLVAHAEGAALMQSVAHTVDSIVDLSQSYHIPPNLMSMYRTLRQRLFLPDNHGMTLVFGFSPSLRTLIYTFSKVSNFYSHDFSLVDSLEEARNILNPVEQRA